MNFVYFLQVILHMKLPFIHRTTDDDVINKVGSYKVMIRSQVSGSNFTIGKGRWRLKLCSYQILILTFLFLCIILFLQNAHAYVNASFNIGLKDGNFNDDNSVIFGGIRSDFDHATATEAYLSGKPVNNNETLQGRIFSKNMWTGYIYRNTYIIFLVVCNTLPTLFLWTLTRRYLR